MGHASIATTNLYLHHLGTAADKAGLARLNSRGYAGVRTSKPNQSDSCEIRSGRNVSCLVNDGLLWVELRGFEPLTFSLRRHGVDLIRREHGVIDVQVAAAGAPWLHRGGTHGAHG